MATAMEKMGIMATGCGVHILMAAKKPKRLILFAVAVAMWTNHKRYDYIPTYQSLPQIQIKYEIISQKDLEPSIWFVADFSFYRFLITKKVFKV